MMQTDSCNSATRHRVSFHSPGERRQFKIACAIVLSLAAFVFTMIFTFGDYPRSFIDRMNMFLAPIVIIELAVAVYAAWLYRRACLACREKDDA